jgi:hypothetical protein
MVPLLNHNVKSTIITFVIIGDIAASSTFWIGCMQVMHVLYCSTGVQSFAWIWSIQYSRVVVVLSKIADRRSIARLPSNMKQILTK